MVEITREIATKVRDTVDAGLVHGIGTQIPGQMCVEAAVCYALGLPHGDDPGCVSTPLRRLKIKLNDSRWSSNEARAKGLRRLAVTRGEPKRFLHGHHGRVQWSKPTVKGYRMATGSKRQTLHRRRAEIALGKPLPKGAEVHHLDETTADNAPLVICQDHAYHALLHKRMRERGMVYPCCCGHEKADHQQRIGQRGNYTPCCVSGCGCRGFRRHDAS